MGTSGAECGRAGASVPAEGVLVAPFLTVDARVAINLLEWVRLRIVRRPFPPE
jgi:hypothetical protein